MNKFTLLDPDPGGKMNADPCGFRSTALKYGQSWVTVQIYLDEVSPARNYCRSLPVFELLKDSPQDRERGAITGPAAVEALI